MKNQFLYIFLFINFNNISAQKLENREIRKDIQDNLKKSIDKPTADLFGQYYMVVKEGDVTHLVPYKTAAQRRFDTIRFRFFVIQLSLATTCLIGLISPSFRDGFIDWMHYSYRGTKELIRNCMFGIYELF